MYDETYYYETVPVDARAAFRVSREEEILIFHPTSC